MDKWYNLYRFEATFREFLLAGKSFGSDSSFLRALGRLSIKNYLSDFRHFVGWFILYLKRNQSGSLPEEQNAYLLFRELTPSTVHDYRTYLASNSISRLTVNRRLSTLRRLCDCLIAQNILYDNPARAVNNLSAKPKRPARPSSSLFSQINKKQKDLENKLTAISNKLPFMGNRLNTGAILASILALIIFTVLTVRIVGSAKAPRVYASTNQEAHRVLSYTGTLIDRFGNAITQATPAQFRLYDSPSRGEALYESGLCKVAPDINGQFTVVIGKTCGGPIPGDLFGKNQYIYLGVTVGTDKEMEPRQRVATVGYSVEANKLQGLTTGTNESSIPFINEEGTLLITASSPTIESSSGTFTIRGEALNFTTHPDVPGIIRFDPKRGGTVIFSQGNVGINTENPTETFTIGEGFFQVDLFGNMVKVNNVRYSWPATQGPKNSVLTNDGDGNLIWSSTVLATMWKREGSIISLKDEADRVGLGTSTPRARLSLAEGTTLEDGIDFGGDTILYRSAVSTLKTDSNFVVGSGLKQIAPVASFFTGNVGFGTQDPKWQLHVRDSKANEASVRIENTSQTTSSSPIALSLRLGSDASNPGTDDRYIAFLRGDSTLLGSIEGNGSGGIKYDTSAGDFAEYFEKADAQSRFEVGDLACLDNAGKVTHCGPQSNHILGVHSTAPGFVGRGDRANNPAYVLVGLIGQIPVKVSLENGPVQAGDRLTSSSIPGMAKKATHRGQIVGTALESSDNGNNGTILALIQPSWYDPTMNLRAEDKAFVYEGATKHDQKISENILALFDSFEEYIGAKFIAAGRIISESVETKSLQSQRIISPIIETDYIVASKGASLTTVETSEIKPQDSEIVINLNSPELSTNTRASTDKGKLASLIIRGFDDAEVATVDAHGNASFKGQLRAASITTQEVKTDVLTAGEIESKTINDLKSRLNDLSFKKQTVDPQEFTSRINEIQKSLAHIQNGPVAEPQAYENIPGVENISLENLAVTGNSHLEKVYVASSLGISNVYIENNSIRSLQSELALSALDQISFFEGTVIMSRDGTLKTLGKIVAKGGIEVHDSRLSIIDRGGAEKAVVNASGEAQFERVTTGEIILKNTHKLASGEAGIISPRENVAIGGISASAIETSSEQAGEGVIPAGEDKVVIYNERVLPNSLIYITATNSTKNNQLYLAEKKPCNDKKANCRASFVVSLEEPVDGMVSFNWLLIN